MDMSPSNCHVSRPITHMITGCTLRLTKMWRATLMQWFQKQPRKFSADRIHLQIKGMPPSTQMGTKLEGL
jgi:hypothetical protein